MPVSVLAGHGAPAWKDKERTHIHHLERKCFLKLNNVFLVFPYAFGLWLNASDRKWMNSRMIEAPARVSQPRSVRP